MYKVTQWLVLTIAIFSSQATNARAEVYVFGDSLSETGNFYLATGGAMPPSPLYFAGRFSNGDAWVEHFAKVIQEPVPMPSLIGGTNFAFNGARATGASPYLTPSMTDQVLTYLAASGGTADPNDTFVIWAGANDIFFGASAGETDSIENAIDAIRWSIESLYGAGARKIVVLDLPPLGETPFFNTVPGVSIQLDVAAAVFNSELSKLLGSIRKEKPLARIASPKISSLFQSIARTPKLYRLSDIRNSATNFDPMTGIGYELVAGVNPDKYLFWDSVHPTARGHSIIAAYVVAEYILSCSR